VKVEDNSEKRFKAKTIIKKPGLKCRYIDFALDICNKSTEDVEAIVI
tara:strand:+ start:4834 stop:4974 length:141 start_codon:yes stop_codon:yes gene_type:complete